MPWWLPLALMLIPGGTLLALLIEAVTGLNKPARPSFMGWWWKVLGVQGALMVASGGYLGLVWAPPEQLMGEVYRIIYAHVPQVWAGLLAMMFNFCCSLLYLFRRSITTDALSEASAEVGLYFGAVGVTLGAIWARPTWGVYWTWDPRLTSAAVMLVYYAGYLAARRFIDNSDSRGTISAVLGVFGITIPVTVYFSVVWMRSLHQTQSTPKTVDPSMVLSLRWSTCAFLCLLIVFVFHRYRIAIAKLKQETAQPEALPSMPGATT